MEYGEKHGLLAPEQFGSRKSLSAIEHALNKHLVLDILQQTHVNVIYIANDAKACYDRIILMVAYLTMRNFGVPALVAKATISSILGMQHKVLTSYGDSETYYGGDKWKTKPHSCGQGYGTELQQPITGLPIHLAAFAFVDDTDIIQTDITSAESVINNTGTDIRQLFDTTQMALNTWSSILQATGGQLELSKTFCVPILHQWQGSTPALCKNLSDNLQIHLNTPDHQQISIEKKDPNTSFFTLGIWQSPSGSEEAHQKQYLLQKMCDWDRKTSVHKLYWAQAGIASRTTFGKTLTYSLPATTFNGADCKVLQKTYMQTLLVGKLGVVRTAPTTLSVAPTWLGGFGIMSFEIEQSISHLGLLLQHGHCRSTITGSLIRMTFEYYVVVVGLPGYPLQLP